jgi:hypothetical protein
MEGNNTQVKVGAEEENFNLKSLESIESCLIHSEIKVNNLKSIFC